MVTTVVQLKAQKRENTGKGVARQLRRDGNIPAIIYGGGAGEITVSASYKELSQEYFKGHFTSKIVELDIDGKVERVIPRDVQVHPVTDAPLHVDFQRVEKGKKVRVFVQVVFKNADVSPGLKRGGVLNIVRRDIELLCDPESVPSKLVVDLAELQIGDSVHVSGINIPTGAEPTITDRDFTIATIVGRMAKVESAVAATEEEGAEGEEGADAEGEDSAEEASAEE